MFDWITGFLEQTGYFGIALLMFAENVFPPIPSELIMPLAGYQSSSGDMNVVLVVLAGSIGSLAGAYLWYVIGQLVGRDRLKRWSRKHGRWLTVAPDDIDQADKWFQRHGGKAVFIGRLVPAVRTLISVPAGISRMPLPRFFLYSTVGTVLWTAFLTGLGWMLGGQYEKVSSWMNPVSNVIVAAIVIYYAWRVATWNRRQRRKQNHGEPAHNEAG